MTVRALAPRPTRPVPAGTFSAPRQEVLTLVAPYSQIWDGRDWRTVYGTGDCDDPRHDVMCRVFDFGVGPDVHLPLSEERRIRHPVADPS